MSDKKFWWASQYASYGWYVVVCHGLRGDKCTCSNPDCATPGKHPILNAWQHKATIDEDELAQWFDGTKNRNIGVQLGEKSGIIDIEFDTDQGRATAERFGLDKSLTPTFTSKRSTHRLFKWDRRLPQQGVYKIGGLEIRIGGGSRGAQSIMPPSVHSSGVSYSWVDGMSPDECEVADIPHELLTAIVNEVGEGAVEKRDSAFKILHSQMGEGDRHDSLVRFAARMCINMVNVHSPVEQQDVLAMIRAMNMFRCNPPKGDDEIQNIFNHELNWAIRKRGAEGVAGDVEKGKAIDERMANGVQPPTEDKVTEKPCAISGLRYDGTEWWPGSWQLKVVHSDPVSYSLTLPVYRATENKTVRVAVPLDAEMYRSAAKVAHAILEATHTVVVDEVPEEWFSIWNGKVVKEAGGKKKAVRGLKAKLMDAAVQEAATAENCRFAAVAGWLMDVLSMAPRPSEDDESGPPDIAGMPTWVRGKDGVLELWFGWTRAWEMVDRGKRKIEAGDMLKIKKMILAGVGERSLPIGRGAGENGSTRRFVRFSQKHLDVLNRLAAGEFGAEGQTAFSIHAEFGNEIQKK